ncbi:MAG: site-specific DNA-methyltransferase [Deltaproteobacteria bacterium]|jgi:DNA modification methylase|nr:site-specific DNA-methyltransferase [Deltaproteobacteria bacterium]
MSSLSQLYSAIQFNSSEIDQSLLDISDKTRSNNFTWNGQFSPQFIEVLLNKYTYGSIVVADPFLGSGTVLLECARKNISAYGVVLNPSAYYISKIYEYCEFLKDERIDLLKKVEVILIKSLITEKPLEVLSSNISECEDNTIKNLLSLLIILIDVFKNNFSKILLMSKWRKIKNIILNLPYTKKTIQAYLGDARNLPYSDNYIDLIITSPPYINVFNYHQNYRKSVELLGFDVLNIAKKEVGSNRKNRSNRLLTVIQYSIDMSLALKEMVRVCKPEARIILVVGRESNVLSSAISNSQLIFDIGSRIFSLSLLLKQQRVFKNKFGQYIYEDILHFSNKNKNKVTILDQDLLLYSREIAVNMLQSKSFAINIDDKLRFYFSDAIKNSHKVFASEGFK